MDASLLRNLGVNEAIIQALQKSHKEEERELELIQDKDDLRLLLKGNRGLERGRHQSLTLVGFFGKNNSAKESNRQGVLPAEEYKCEDAFEFLHENDPLKDNLIINDVGLRLCESLLKPLRYLAQKTVDTKTGWVYIQDMKSEGVIPQEGYQSFSRLRSALAGYLIKKNGKDLIEANGRKQYRLSIDPRNIRLPKAESKI
jgi:hypothetical protein